MDLQPQKVVSPNYSILVRGEVRYLVETEGRPGFELIEPSFLSRQIKLDEQELRRRVHRARATAQEQAEHQTASFDDHGFLATLTGVQANRARTSLSKSVSHNGVVKRLADLIVTAVQQGARVSNRRLMWPDGRFLDERAVTKTGLAFAEYLTAHAPREQAKRPAGGVTIRYGQPHRIGSRVFKL